MRGMDMHDEEIDRLASWSELHDTEMPRTESGLVSFAAALATLGLVFVVAGLFWWEASQ